MITNGPADVQSAKIDLLGLRPYFDFCLISGEFGIWKPDRAIFQEALALGRAASQQAVMIGDSAEHDMAGAEGAGIPTIWMNRHDLPWPAEIPAPSFVARDLARACAACSHSQQPPSPAAFRNQRRKNPGHESGRILYSFRDMSAGRRGMRFD